MVAIIADAELEAEVIARRRATGADRLDEVWDGVYFMSPIANDEHQKLANRLAFVLTGVIELPGLGEVRNGTNISDRRKDWTKNYRCPDVAVFLNDTKAVNRDTHWYGGPDFAIEIVSPNDRTLEKIPFYEQVGTRELLVVDRDPWTLTLYRLADGRLSEIGRSNIDGSQQLCSGIVPLHWRLVSDEGVPAIEIVHADGVQLFLVRSAAK